MPSRLNKEHDFTHAQPGAFVKQLIAEDSGWHAAGEGPPSRLKAIWYVYLADALTDVPIDIWKPGPEGHFRYCWITCRAGGLKGSGSRPKGGGSDA